MIRYQISMAFLMLACCVTDLANSQDKSTDQAGNSAALKTGDKTNTTANNNDPTADTESNLTSGASKRIPMPGVITDAVQAQKGEILLISLGLEKKLVVVDLRAASIVKILPLPSEDVLVAGTMDHIVTFDRVAGVLARYDLKTFQIESSVKQPVKGIIESITAGIGSQGPVLLQRAESNFELSEATFHAIDLKSLRELPLEFKGSGPYMCYRDTIHVRASSNGKVFGIWTSSQRPQGIKSIEVTENQLVTKYEGDSAGHILPSANSRHLMTGMSGVLTAELKALSSSPNPPSFHVPCLPTSHPRFYVSIPAGPGRPGEENNLGPKATKGMRPGIHELSSDAAILDLPDLKLNLTDSITDGSWAPHDFLLDKRVYLNLTLSRLVSIPFTNDSVIVQQFDFVSELKKSKLDYLFVSSIPNDTFLPGMTYDYPIVVQSNKNGAKFKLVKGPEMMEVSKDGKVTWKVPPDFSQKTVDVMIAISQGDSVPIHESLALRNAANPAAK